jgi:hypothetical protein
MQSNRFKLTVKGDRKDQSIRLSALVHQLNSLKQTLGHVATAIGDGEASDLCFRIVGITMNSPATFEVEAISQSGKKRPGMRVVSKLKRDILSITAGRRPVNANIDLLESYCALVKPMQQYHAMEVSLDFDGEEVPLPQNLDIKVDDILGPDQTERGSVTGSLEVLDVHDKHNVFFKIYPIVGPRTIKCHFRQDMLAQAIAGINHFVRVYGLLNYKKSEKFPHIIKADTMEIIPESSHVYPISALRGIAPDAYDDMTSTEYVEKVRNAEW